MNFSRCPTRPQLGSRQLRGPRRRVLCGCDTHLTSLCGQTLIFLFCPHPTWSTDKCAFSVTRREAAQIPRCLQCQLPLSSSAPPPPYLTPTSSPSSTVRSPSPWTLSQMPRPRTLSSVCRGSSSPLLPFPPDPLHLPPVRAPLPAAPGGMSLNGTRDLDTPLPKTMASSPNLHHEF